MIAPTQPNVNGTATRDCNSTIKTTRAYRLRHACRECPCSCAEARPSVRCRRLPARELVPFPPQAPCHGSSARRTRRRLVALYTGWLGRAKKFGLWQRQALRCGFCSRRPTRRSDRRAGSGGMACRDGGMQAGGGVIALSARGSSPVCALWSFLCTCHGLLLACRPVMGSWDRLYYRWRAATCRARLPNAPVPYNSPISLARRAACVRSCTFSFCSTTVT